MAFLIRWLPSIVASLLGLLGVFNAPVQDFVVAHPAVSAVVAAAGTVIAHLIPSPRAEGGQFVAAVMFVTLGLVIGGVGVYLWLLWKVWGWWGKQMLLKTETGGIVEIVTLPRGDIRLSAGPEGQPGASITMTPCEVRVVVAALEAAAEDDQ